VISIIKIAYDVSHEVSIKVNQVLEEKASFFIELGRNEIEKCKKVVYELQEFAADGYLHILKYGCPVPTKIDKNASYKSQGDNSPGSFCASSMGAIY
jgi:hypothetical protein